MIRTKLHAKSIWVTMFYRFIVLPINAVLIKVPSFRICYIYFIKVPIIDSLHWNRLIIPEKHCTFGTRCEGTKYNPFFYHMSSQPLISIKNLSCIKTIEVHHMYFPPLIDYRLIFYYNHFNKVLFRLPLSISGYLSITRHISKID